ncbi:unnamed protein product [Clonostachys rosea f. rosea IK726]|uniref:Uncharacterized protein n=1 Tax=Clonostachys rosea f. rosea IK726 TaxID=1349383 RepID=A0ACA9T734_BIOOC|nr:unnamed protein product [Clonostachys rosea f. rosea IK726]
MHRIKSCRWRELRSFGWSLQPLLQNARQPRRVRVNEAAALAYSYHSPADDSDHPKPKVSIPRRLPYDWEEQKPVTEEPSPMVEEQRLVAKEERQLVEEQRRWSEEQNKEVQRPWPRPTKLRYVKVHGRAHETSKPPEKSKALSKSRQRHQGLKGIMVAKKLSSDFICFKEGSDNPAPITPEDESMLSTAQQYFGEAYQELYSASRLSEHAINTTVPEIALIGAMGTRKATFINGLFGLPDNYGVGSLHDEVIKMSMYGVNFPVGCQHGKGLPIKLRPPNGFILADTPEYALIKRPSWGKEVVNYLEKRENLKGAILLLSLSKPFREMDRWVLRHLAHKRVNTSVILTGAQYFPKRWEEVAAQRARQVRQEMISLDVRLDNGWVRNNGWMPDIHVVAPGMEFQPSIGNGGGLGGARKAILELAGFDLTKTFQKDISVRGNLNHVASFNTPEA